MTIARTILRIGVSVFSILLAMLTGAILILLIGKDPILAYGFLFRGAFGSLPSIGETIVKVTPLIFTGLAAVFSYQCGMLNLGIEGQFIAGAIAANWLSTIVLPFTGAANMILSLIGGMAAGAVWSAIPGLLKALRRRWSHNRCNDKCCPKAPGESRRRSARGSSPGGCGPPRSFRAYRTRSGWPPPR